VPPKKPVTRIEAPGDFCARIIERAVSPASAVARLERETLENTKI